MHYRKLFSAENFPQSASEVSLGNVRVNQVHFHLMNVPAQPCSIQGAKKYWHKSRPESQMCGERELEVELKWKLKPKPRGIESSRMTHALTSICCRNA